MKLKDVIDHQKAEIKHKENQVDKFKIALIEFDRHMREEILLEQEFVIQ